MITSWHVRSYAYNILLTTHNIFHTLASRLLLPVNDLASTTWVCVFNNFKKKNRLMQNK